MFDMQYYQESPKFISKLLYLSFCPPYNPMIECYLLYIYEAKCEISNELEYIKNVFLNFKDFRRRNHSHGGNRQNISIVREASQIRNQVTAKFDRNMTPSTVCV